ncbi:hypothetical protein UGMREWDR_CDS0013 [Aeromonas phage GomatiRiver_11]|nr:hypothetical protein OBDJBBDK_00013 [Aeromonas phage AhFM11]WKW84180.1 hypothetical protein UGMREWDR_CDS0013 [Aeromonas phage GomatiRiver_11]
MRLIPIRFDGVYAENVKIFTINTEEQAAEAGIDIEWLMRENMTGRIVVTKDTVLLDYHDRVIGMVVQHDKPTNQFIRTSPIQMIVHMTGDFRPMTVVFTQNSRYEVFA